MQRRHTHTPIESRLMKAHWAPLCPTYKCLEHCFRANRMADEQSDGLKSALYI